MATVNLSIPADLMRAARAKLAGGEAHVKAYLISSLQSLADDDEPLDRETIRALIEGASSPKLAGTEAYWAAKIRSYRKRHRDSKSRRRS